MNILVDKIPYFEIERAARALLAAADKASRDPGFAEEFTEWEKAGGPAKYGEPRDAEVQQ